MKLHIWPEFGKEKGQGGIKRVVEAQRRYLPEHGIEIVDDPRKADLINCHADLLIHKQIPIVYSSHGLYWAGHKWFEWAHQKNAEIIRQVRHPLVKAVTTPSQWVSHAFQRGMLLNPHTVYHGVNLDDWEPVNRQGYVLWCKTRVDSICTPDALHYLVKKRPDVPFMSTFGETNHRNLTVLDKALPFHDFKPLLQKAAVYLANVKETGGITVLEAMATGVPPLAFDHGVNPEIIDHMETGYLAPAGDYEALLEGLEYCLQHRDRLGANARQAVIERWQWKDRIQDYLPVFNAALEPVQGPKVSVVVTAYNLEEYLPVCIQSILEQDFADWELIIVDDNSPDQCGRIADAFANLDPRIKVIHNPTNVYLAEARNVGMRQARGQYFLPLDADDRLAPDALTRLVKALDTDPDVDIVTGAMALIEDDGREWVSDWPPLTPAFNQQIRFRNQLPYASLYRRWVWKETGGYRRRMHSAEDAEFWTRAMSYGALAKKVTTHPTLIYSNRQNSMSHTIPTPNWLEWFTWSQQAYTMPFGASDPPRDQRTWLVHSYDPVEVSVIVPVGPGHVPYLQDCLDSLVAQTFMYWEVILVNDTGIPWLDHTGKIVNDLLAGFPFARIVDSQGPPQGPGWARNRGIEASHSPIFVLLDADDYVQPMFLDFLIKAHREVGGWIYTDWYDQLGQEKKAKDFHFDQAMLKMPGPSTGIYSKSDWEFVGGFPEDTTGYEDWRYQMRLMNAGICGSRISLPLFTYRYQAGTRREADFSHAKDIVKWIRDEFTLLYQKGEHYMACKKCPGGGNVTDLRMQYTLGNETFQGAEMVEIEYVGPQLQKQRIKSKAQRGLQYIYDGNKNKRFFVLAAEAERFLSRPSDFILVPRTSPQIEIRGAENGKMPVIRVQRDPVVIEPEVVNTPLEMLDLPPEVISILKNSKFEFMYVEEVDRASDADLMTIKGVATKRLGDIRNAVVALRSPV